MIWNINWAHTQTTQDGSETMKNTERPSFSQQIYILGSNTK